MIMAINFAKLPNVSFPSCLGCILICKGTLCPERDSPFESFGRIKILIEIRSGYYMCEPRIIPAILILLGSLLAKLFDVC